MSVERSGNNRGRGVPGSYTYISKHPAQNERFGVYGIFIVHFFHKNSPCATCHKTAMDFFAKTFKIQKISTLLQ